MLSPGDSFGDYTVVRLLGKGGMGAVFLLQAADGTEVAAKILDPESAGDAESRKRFLREAQLALGVKHPNLVEVYDVGEDPETGLCYILMEYVPGGSLADYLKEQGALPIEDAVAVVEAMAQVLELARQKGIVHRDIKPGNIMFDVEGTPKLADLGIARGGLAGTETTTVTQTGMMIGTPAYMAPEQMLDAHTVDTRADIYSLGVVFFEMLTGERPNKNDTVVQLMAKAVKGEPLPDVRTLRPEVSASLAQLLAMMVAPDKEGRISTPGQITGALAIIERGGDFASTNGRTRIPVAPHEEHTSFHWKILVPVGILAALAAVFVLFAPKREPRTQAAKPVERTIVKTVVQTNVVEKVVEKTRMVERTAAMEKKSAVANREGAEGDGMLKPQVPVGRRWQPGPSDKWFVNWDDAMVDARARKSILLVLNAWQTDVCRRLQTEVFGKEVFDSFARRKLTLVYLGGGSSNADQRNHDRRLVHALKFGGGSPDAALFDVDGRFYGNVWGDRLSAEAYVKTIMGLLAGNGRRMLDDRGQLLFERGYATLAAEFAKLPKVVKDDFKVKLVGVSVVDGNDKFDVEAKAKADFRDPDKRLEVPFGKAAVFKVEYDFPDGYEASILTMDKWPDNPRNRCYGGNNSRTYKGRGEAFGQVWLVEKGDEFNLKSVVLHLVAYPEIDDATRRWDVVSCSVDILFRGESVEERQRATAKMSADDQKWVVDRDDVRPVPAVRICYDQSHGGGINEDGAFYLPLLADEKGFAHKPCWYGLADEGLSHVNAVVLPPSWNDIPYLAEERTALRAFMEKGGTVFAIVDGNESNLSIAKGLLAEYGADVVGRGVARDDAPCRRGRVLSPALDDIRNIDFAPSAVVLAKTGKDASAWTAMIVTEEDEPVLACRFVGKGRLVFASAGLHFSRDRMREHPGTCRLWKRLFLSAAIVRRLSPNSDIAPRDVLSPPCTLPVGPLTFHYAKRWEKEARKIGEYVKKSLPVLREMKIPEPQADQISFCNVALLGTGNMHWYWTGGKRHMVGILWGGSPEHPGALVSELVENMLNGVVQAPEDIPLRDYLAVQCLRKIGLQDEYARTIQTQWGDGPIARYCRAFDAIRNDCPNFPATFCKNWSKASKDALATEFFSVLSKSIGRDCRPYFTKEGIVAFGLGQVADGGADAADGPSVGLAFSDREIQQMKGQRGDKAVQKALDRLFPGWKVSGCVGVADEDRNRIGYIPEIEERRNVCCTLPRDVRSPVKLQKTVVVPKEGGLLQFSVRKVPDTESGFRLEIQVDGKIMNEYRIDDDNWVDDTFDLAAWKGKKIRLEVRHVQLAELKNARALWSRLEVK